MEELIALAKVVNRQKVKQIDVITSENPLSDKAKVFYEGLIDDQIKSDEDATKLIYDEELISSKYRKLKSRLQSKLINTLFFIDIQKFRRNDYENYLVKGYLTLSAIKILRSRGYTAVAAKFSEDVLKKSITYDLTEVVYILSTDLARHYTVFNFSKPKSKEYLNLADKYAEIFYYENKANKIFAFFAYYINQNIGVNRIEYAPQIMKEITEVKERIGLINTYNFNFQARNAMYFKAYLENDIEGMEQISRQAVDFFRTKKGFRQGGEFSFLQKLGIAYQALKKYNEAIEVYNDAYKLNPTEGKRAWYNIRMHLFNSHLSLKEYDEAYEYLLEATTHKAFSKLIELYREPWIIKEAYMHLLIKMGKVVEDKTAEKRLRPFRIGRFLNEVEHFSRDKRGLNIAVHIIHALFLFIKKDEDALERRLDALGQYSFRYLRNDETLRSNAFIKMLQKMPDAGYNAKRLQRYADKYYQRLINAPQIIAENSKEVEVIPYEHLWDIIIELLEMRERKEI